MAGYVWVAVCHDQVTNVQFWPKLAISLRGWTLTDSRRLMPERTILATSTISHASNQREQASAHFLGRQVREPAMTGKQPFKTIRGQLAE